MDSPIFLILLGSLISLVSTIVTITVQHKLSMQKTLFQNKQYPFQVTYNKQIEFFDSVMHTFINLNLFITLIDFWLGENINEAKGNIKQIIERDKSVYEYNNLLERYYIYLPKKLLKKAKELSDECFILRNNPNQKTSSKSISTLFDLQNEIREFIGTDKLSDDFLKALGNKRKNILD